MTIVLLEWRGIERAPTFQLHGITQDMQDGNPETYKEPDEIFIDDAISTPPRSTKNVKTRSVRIGRK